MAAWATVMANAFGTPLRHNYSWWIGYGFAAAVFALAAVSLWEHVRPTGRDLDLVFLNGLTAADVRMNSRRERDGEPSPGLSCPTVSFITLLLTHDPKAITSGRVVSHRRHVRRPIQFRLRGEVTPF